LSFTPNASCEHRPSDSGPRNIGDTDECRRLSWSPEARPPRAFRWRGI